jgi:hypothetical protein
VPISLAITIAALILVQVVLVAIISAIRPSGNVYVTIVAVSLVTAPVALALAGVLLGPSLGGAGRMFLVVIHLALGGFFFHFMTLPDRSVTLRILVELLLAPGRTLSTDALKSRYGVGTMIKSRLEQLSAGRFMEVSPAGGITLTGKGLLLGRVVTAGRALFGIVSAN